MNGNWLKRTGIVNVKNQKRVLNQESHSKSKLTNNPTEGPRSRTRNKQF